ncbi:MAG: ribosomal protein S5-alanine N-acetyltransferase [Vibrio anguillarum]
MMQSCSTLSQVYEVDNDILVRTAKLEDGEMLAAYFTSNREHLRPGEPKRDAAFFEAHGWAQRLIKLGELHKMQLGYYLLIIDINSGDMLGTISFSNLSRFPFYACNLGYSLAKNAQGKGIMGRALKMACHYMFKVQNLHRIMAGYKPINKRSEAVLMKMGFQAEGHAKNYLLIDGQWEDHNLTALVNADWRPS